MFKNFRQKAKRYSRSSSRHSRLGFEALEGRRVLATYFVDTLNDTSGGVCAADNSAANSFCSIRDAITEAQANPGADRIEIPAGTYILTQGSLDVDQTNDVELVGTAATPSSVILDGAGSRVFDLFASDATSNITIASMTIRNGVGNDGSGGGAINAGGDVDLTINNVVFQNNSAPAVLDPLSGNRIHSGGAIQASGNLSINNSTFDGNSASRNGGAIDFGAADATKALSITATTFSGNSASFTGGAIDGSGGVVTFDSVRFLQNDAGDSAGGAFLADQSQIAISNGEFFQNVARGDNGTDGISGGLYIQDTRPAGGLGVDGVTIANTVFRENHAFDSGAGATILNSVSSITDTSFIDNVVDGSGITFETGGGGLALQDDLTTGNTGSISRTSLVRVNVRGNSAPAGGGVSVVNAFLEVTDSDISNNTATEASTGGGGIGIVRGIARQSANELDLILRNSTVNNNTTAGGGGGIGGIDASLFIEDSTIDGNTANTTITGAGGGGIGIIGNSFEPRIVIQSVTLSNNTARANGGGIGVINGQLTLFNATISDNAADGSGGGILYSNNNTSFSAGITFSTIASNSAGVAGANVAVIESVVRFESSIIADPRGTATASNFFTTDVGSVASLGFNLVSDSSSGFRAASDLVNTDPLLGPLADNGGGLQTRALLAASPAIDAGSGLPVPTDARGLARPFDGDGDGTARSDIGAFEAQTSSGGVIANNDSVTTQEDRSIDIDVVANDTGGPLTILIDTTPTRGTATIVGNQVRYVPDNDLFGLDSFVYRSQNNTGEFDLATVTVTVISVNDEPLAGDDTFAFTNDQPQTISLSELTANDLAGPGDEATESISFVSATQPSFGTLAIGSVSLVYTPQAGFVGIDSFSYSIVDDGGLTSTATVNINLSDPVTTLPTTVTLSTGNGEGDLTVTLDGYGAFGTSELGGAGAIFDPIGSVPSASTVFRAYNAFRNGTSGPNTALSSSSLAGVPIQANTTSATSTFTVDGFQIALTQTVQPRFDAAGLRAGAELVQTYTVMNVSAIADTFDITRYIDGDLQFDGTLLDGGGILTQPDGNLVLFETDRGGGGATDTTFVGIRSTGGILPATGRFEIDLFSGLNSDILNGVILTETVFGDSDGNNFIDPGAESDVALALRRLLTIPLGTTGVYETTTMFGQRPDQVLPQDPGSLSGHVFCDANGNGIEDSGEATVDAIVFIDTNGNRSLDPGELNTLTNSIGDYQFASVPGGITTVALILPSTCHGLPTQFGTVASSLSVGSIPRDLEATDFDGDGDVDLLVVSDISNTLTILGNVNGSLTEVQTISLDSRLQAVAAMSGASGPALVAVAAFGSPSASSTGSVDNRAGVVYRIQGTSVESFRMGNGPIDVAIADFNSDGLPDIVSAASRSSDFHLLLGGSITPRTIGTLDNAISVTTGDFDGDGNQDIAMAGYGRLDLPSRDRLPGRVQVLLGDGAGGFNDAGVTMSFNEPVDLRSANLNSSGGDELIVLGYLGELGVFSLGPSGVVQTSSIALAKGVRKIEVGELNRDGLQDVAIVNPSNEVITLLRGDGNGGLIVTKELRAQSTDVHRAPADVVFGAFRDGADDELVVAYAYRQNAAGGFGADSSTTLVRLGIGQATAIVSSTTTAIVDFTPTTRLDVDGNQVITAGDALAVISEMNAAAAEGEQLAVRTTLQTAADVNQDGYVSAVDALMIINYLNLADAKPNPESEQAMMLPPLSIHHIDDETRMLELLIEDQLRLRANS